MTTIRTVLFLTLFSGCSIAGPGMDQQMIDYDEQRRQLIAELKEDIQSAEVLQAIEETPRHEFVPDELKPQAYLNRALSIGYGQTISQPLIVAMMTEALQPKPTDKILEIGLGSGYQAAVLSKLVAEVYSIELVESLAKKTISLLRRLDYKNIHARIGDGSYGWLEEAPFDSIIVTAAPEKLPDALFAQVKDGGRIVIPVGKEKQELMLFIRHGKIVEERKLGGVRFVPMLGEAAD